MISDKRLSPQDKDTLVADFTAQKVAVLPSTGGRKVVDIKASKTYVIPSAGGCTVRKSLPTEKFSKCLTADAKFLHTLTFGIEYPVTMYRYKTSVGGVDITDALVLIEPGVGSYPVIVKYYGPAPPQGDILKIVADPVTSVADRSVFNVPDNCQETPVVG
ncbi:uncharacterized protein LOC101864075 [Aplysia californica]|uniref:Uncharacterized protein LOC101864075 n=1 Tax=Aplysia californica TaxID=6500 RepID=A0ABM0JUF2_APLCA|nr:uncharacterized protein LOC101864075 [Aplysia californica]